MSEKSIRCQIFDAVNELFAAAPTKPGQILVVGCSTSEVLGQKIGTSGDIHPAKDLFEVLFAETNKRGMFLACQCCEHLNRAIVTERACAEKYGLTEVMAVPHEHAGGSFATAAYKAFSHPVMVEHVKAAAGIDIGGTLIGMHLREVAVPTRLSIKQIGEANIICARTRPKFIGGQRAHYDESQM